MVNISEGRDRAIIAAIASAGGDAVLDVHADADHHRSVITLAGDLQRVDAETREVVTAAVARIDLTDHFGVHPRLGAADVVPVVPLLPGEAAWRSAVAIRDELAEWIGIELSVPCFLYGPERTLPEVRRAGLPRTRSRHRARHPTSHGRRHRCGRPPAHDRLQPLARGRRNWAAGAARCRCCRCGPGPGCQGATERSPDVRALGLAVRGGAQVSCNLLVPTGPAMESLFDDVTTAASSKGCRVARAEVVGLIPGSTLAEIPRHRWLELGIGEDLTIEARWTNPDLRPDWSGHRPDRNRPESPAPS